MATTSNRPTPPLAGKTVGLSISNNEDLNVRGFYRIHLNTFMYEVSRALFRSGASISYGGHLQNEGLTAESLQHLLDEQQSTAELQRIWSYVAWPLQYHPAVPNQLTDKFKEFAEFPPLPPPDDFDGPEKEYLDPEPIPNRYYWFRSLTAMRREMNSNIQARVVMGGKLHKFVGRYPGVVEEVMYAVTTRTPLYICGGFGGAAWALAQLFQGNRVPDLEPSSQYADEIYAASVSYYETAIASNLREKLSRMTPYGRFVGYSVDCALLCEFFREIGVKGLNNGLSPQENEILFETPFIDEIRALVLAGLTRLFREQREQTSSCDQLENPSAAFTRAIRGAGGPRSPLIDLQEATLAPADEVWSLEESLFARLGDQYTAARRSALQQCAPAILQQFSSKLNARSLLSLDLAALNWSPARGDVAIAGLLAEMCKTHPAIAECEAVRRRLPHASIRLNGPETATPVTGADKRPEGGGTSVQGNAHFEKAAVKPWFEDVPLDWTRPPVKETLALLRAGYPTKRAALALAKDAGLDVTRLDQEAEVRFLLQDIMEKARQSDRLPLVLAEVLLDLGQEGIHGQLRALIAGFEGTIAAAAVRRKPSISTLALLPSSIEVLRSGDTAPQPLATPGLEKVINAAAGFVDPAIFRLRLAEAEVRTARIDIGGQPAGTGFLIGDSLLLTNWHVVNGGIKGAVAVFDNKVTAKGEQDAGRAVAFASEWLVAHSGYDAWTTEAGPDGPSEGNWDFAVVRLAEPVGTQAIGPDPKAIDADKRGCYRLNGNPYDFKEPEPILIVGHPSGRPVQLSYAARSEVKLTKCSNRVRYQTNTEPGSSGSPVFNRDWRVVALHHAAGPTSVPGDFNLPTGDFNQGIPISGIVTELKKQMAGRPELVELGLA